MLAGGSGASLWLGRSGNTARLMDNSPTLLRLSELETLERLMQKVKRVDLHAGTEGMDALLGLLRARRLLRARPAAG